jgi:phosphopantothenoylcysteine decarboxylase/phosphopantothenate--cysteine ligase
MRVLLGVTAGIAAYKSAELVRAFVKRGDDVRAVMTEGAREFIRPMTLQVLSENPVGTEVFDPQYESEIGHIDLARWADAVLVAPATADAIARMAHGMGDDLLTTVLLATGAPVVVAPAMNTKMWRHEMVQRNVDTLGDVPQFTVVDPDEGELACKEVGPGRMPDAPVLVEEVRAAIAPQTLEGHRVLVTAGPTREKIDPARMLTNPSSGKMGYAVARVARRRGARTTLVAGPTALEPPMGVEVVEVESAAEMHRAVMDRAPESDFVCKAAAVCDWRPKRSSDEKLDKEEVSAELELERTADILAELGSRYGPGGSEEGPMVIGFAAETGDVREQGRAKRERKGAHMLVANRVGGPHSTFGADDVRAHIIMEGECVEFDGGSKERLADAIWERAAALR